MREKLRDRERLQHIVEAAQNILEFTKGTTYEEFLNSKVTQFAVVKNFEIIGEAAYYLTKELRSQSEGKIEWRKIIAFRHILVHDYWLIDYQTVWNAIVNKVPDLIESVEEMLHE